MTMLRWPVLLPFACFLLLFGVFTLRLVKMSQGDMPNDIKTVLIDKEIPAFALPPLLAGQAGLTSADLAGKVTLVNFFASWCVPCRVEHPLLASLAGKVTLVGVAYKNDAKEARAWIEAMGNPYQTIGIDRDGRLGIDFGVYAVPESYLIDRQGRIRYAWKRPFSPEEIRTTLLPLIDELSK